MVMNMELMILHQIQNLHTPWLDPIMIGVSTLGNGGTLWIAIALLMLCFKKTRKCGIIMAVSMLGCYVLGNLVIKNLVARTRPFRVDETVQLLIAMPGEYSFPSGHTMNSFTAATVIFAHFKKPGIVAILLAVIIAFSRMYLFVHYPTDILAGFLIGVGMALFVLWLSKQNQVKRIFDKNISL